MARILVIEDEFDIRDEVMNWLEFEGHEVIGAENGKQGLEAICREHPDLVFCDICMPVMNGHQVLSALRANQDCVNIPFVFLTAAADQDTMYQSKGLGADEYLVKPFSHAEIIGIVKARTAQQK